MDLCPRISFMPSDGVKTALANLGRTEDVQFSPDDRRLAIAGYGLSKLLILDIKVKTAKGKILVVSDDWLEITSPSFNYPHGLFWIDSNTLIIANRSTDVPIIKIPAEKPESRTQDCRSHAHRDDQARPRLAALARIGLGVKNWPGLV